MADRVENLVICGVGLVGGSIGLAALATGAARNVTGVGRNADRLRAAKATGAVTVTTTDLADASAHADLIVICTPVDTIASTVIAAAQSCRRPALITDVGSAKAAIVASVPSSLPGGVRFLGGHPLAGSEKTGVEHARADLFAGRMTVLTPAATSAQEDVSRLSAFWRQLGATIKIMSPEEHDRAVAATSHAPHLIAAALAAAMDDDYLPLVSTGWLDATRIAAMDAQVWRPIFAANREHTLKALDAFETTLANFRAALEGRDEGRLTDLLFATAARRESLSRERD